jgi:predicted transcriptional regulator
MSQTAEKEHPVHIGAYVPGEQRDGLTELARRQYRSVSSVIRQAIAAELERERERNDE